MEAATLHHPENESCVTTDVFTIRSDIGNCEQLGEFGKDLMFVRATVVADRQLAKGSGGAEAHDRRNCRQFAKQKHRFSLTGRKGTVRTKLPCDVGYDLP